MKKIMLALLVAAMLLNVTLVLGGCGEKKELRTHTEETWTEVHTRTIVE